MKCQIVSLTRAERERERETALPLKELVTTRRRKVEGAGKRRKRKHLASREDGTRREKERALLNCTFSFPAPPPLISSSNQV
jgi:hypothetical protein